MSKYINSSFSLVFVVYYAARRKIIRTSVEDRVLNLWAFLLMMICLAGIYELLNALTVKPFMLITRMPLDVIAATVGMYMSFLLLRQEILKWMSLANIALIVLAVLGTLFPLRSIFRIVLHSSMILIINLLFMGFYFYYKKTKI